ncbi:hypothetical protein RM553_07070 [Zunongwangia sp. F363]|uniref:site-specific DNA-methyltransferase (cytosine-N(4)-specific) n=1 Tax=Autumnicola tepida TaxID=3075595 RepID=A0ABU3C8C1_9FLAO|nr:hypothetical protein [Zunongwangia sp. F363]MDT0642593.1 hypothetical protein [Zunongwangia sp. F363]
MDNRVNFDFDLKDKSLSNSLNSIELPRHRWYFYKEGFSPILVERAIKDNDLDSSGLVVDPFNGSGTTTLTSSLFGVRSVGIEVNPFTHFLSSVKHIETNVSTLLKIKDEFLESIANKKQSPLLEFSTFSENSRKDRFLFNSEVLNSFEGGWQYTTHLKSRKNKSVLQLASIIAAMQNCNAKKDGKCLRYRDNWKSKHYDSTTYLQSVEKVLDSMIDDLNSSGLKSSTKLYNSDIRNSLNKNKAINNFNLCITSPPYLNTFDYTDIYRPELFLGKFVLNQESLYDLRLKTVRSHIQAKWRKPLGKNYGIIFKRILENLNSQPENLMHKNIPSMIQAYFEDMERILQALYVKAAKNSELWIVVSNSAYANIEIPVDLILADIGSTTGWKLKEIGVLRNVRKRKTKYSPDVEFLRESVVILRKSF